VTVTIKAGQHNTESNCNKWNKRG